LNASSKKLAYFTNKPNDNFESSQQGDDRNVSGQQNISE